MNSLLASILELKKYIDSIDENDFIQNSTNSLFQLLETITTEQNYALALLLQTERLQNDELFFYSNLEAWLTATNVVDLGSGPPFSLQFLKRFFPNKRFTAVEILPAFSSMAADFQDIQTIHGDISYFHPPQPFDFGILKSVLQHMKDDAALLTNLKNTIRVGGYLLINDSNSNLKISSITHNPTIQSLHKMYLDVEEHQNGRRYAISNFVTRATDNGWIIKHTGIAGVSISKHPEKLAFAKEEIVRCALIAKFLGPTVTLQQLHTEFKDWIQSSNSFSSSVSQRFLLQRSY